MKRKTILKIGIVVLAAILGASAGYMVPRRQLAKKGYDKQEVKAIMAIDKDERQFFFERDKIDGVTTWLELSNNYPRFIDYTTYQKAYPDLSSEDTKAVVDLMNDHSDIFMFSSIKTKHQFFQLANKQCIEDYYEDMKADELMQNPSAIDALVKKDSHFSMSYIPDDLEKCAIATSEGNEPVQYMRKEANEALKKMADDAKKEGYILLNNSSYRSYFEQEDIYAYYLEEYGQEYCDDYVGDPGVSEHQSGLAIDLTSQSVEDGDYFVFGESPDYDWVVDHCASYGFVLRYPEDKSDITNVANEPWHFRYVGVDIATEMQKNNWVLEEYHAHR